MKLDRIPLDRWIRSTDLFVVSSAHHDGTDGKDDTSRQDDRFPSQSIYTHARSRAGEHINKKGENKTIRAALGVYQVKAYFLDELPER